MSDTVIKVENLSKLYRLGEVPLRYTFEGQAGTLYYNINKWYNNFCSKRRPGPTKIAGAMLRAGCDGLCDKIATIAVRN